MSVYLKSKTKWNGLDPTGHRVTDTEPQGFILLGHTGRTECFESIPSLYNCKCLRETFHSWGYLINKVVLTVHFDIPFCKYFD